MEEAPMMRVEPTGAVLGASIHGVDLTQPIDRATFGQILNTLGRYGVVRFPGQQIELGDLKRFSEMFGEIQGNPISTINRDRPFPEIGILSNVKENGAYIGSPDAGQDWHTDRAATARRWAGPSSRTCTWSMTRCRRT
jgi:taurine dioxygenase